jgi:hypothetical protein
MKVNGVLGQPVADRNGGSFAAQNGAHHPVGIADIQGGLYFLGAFPEPVPAGQAAPDYPALSPGRDFAESGSTDPLPAHPG